MKELKDIEVAVRHILALYPNARSNDKLLMLYFWRDIDCLKIPQDFWHDFLTKATLPETIRRTRQKIQSQGEYLPDEETLQKRKKAMESFKEYSQTRLF